MADWGDVPTWVQAIGVTATLGFLAWQVGSAADQVDLTRQQIDNDRQSDAEQIRLLKDQGERDREFNQDQIRLLRRQLELQTEELLAIRAEREREAIERRRAKAAMVFLLIESVDHIANAYMRPSTPSVSFRLSVINSSQQPIYDVLIRWHAGNAPWIFDGTDTDSQRQLLPDSSIVLNRDYTGGGNLTTVGAVVEFRDSTGLRWRRRENGELDEIDSRTA